MTKGNFSRQKIDLEKKAKPSHAFPPPPDRFPPPQRQITEFSRSTDTSAGEELQAHYVRSELASQSAGQLPRAVTLTFV
jgi:hypothetical protein